MLCHPVGVGELEARLQPLSDLGGDEPPHDIEEQRKLGLAQVPWDLLLAGVEHSLLLLHQPWNTGFLRLDGFLLWLMPVPQQGAADRTPPLDVR